MPESAVTDLVRAGNVILGATCRQHMDRGKRMLRVAIDRAGTEKPSDAEELMLEIVRFLAEECDDDPLAAPLVRRARRLGLLP